MNGARRTWWYFGAGTFLVFVMMTLISLVVLELERDTVEAQAEAAHQEAIRAALWRMDSWLASRLVSEASRPYFEYRPFFSQRDAYTPVLNRLETDSILTPSPLLTFTDDVLALHFQIDADGTITSPQVPTGNYRDLSEAELVDQSRLALNSDNLARVQGCLDVPFTELCSIATTPPFAQTVSAPPLPQQQIAQGNAQLDQQIAQQQMRNNAEWMSRTGTSQKAQKLATKSATLPPAQQGAGADVKTEPTIQVGPLVPAWRLSPETGTSELVYLRQVDDGTGTFLQGFLVEWSRLESALLGQIFDLFAVASLVPVDPGVLDAEEAHRGLATLPASLDVVRPPAPPVQLMTPARIAVALTWIVVILAVFATGMGLRANIAYAERRHRFASAVTHELRTPLTTFQMYSEMLAEGMVCDPAQRQAYLDTMHLESGRLAALVENVLGYARLEKGGGATRCRPTEVAALLEQVTARLERRAGAGGMTLNVECDDAANATVNADTEATGQILLNLVDNACKYANTADPRAITLSASTTDAQVVFAITDNGPGVPAGCEKRIFAAFDRAGRRTADSTGGIGLGLALSRGLALDQGGELRLAANGDDGARFELVLRRTT